MTARPRRTNLQQVPQRRRLARIVIAAEDRKRARRVLRLHRRFRAAHNRLQSLHRRRLPHVRLSGIGSSGNRTQPKSGRSAAGAVSAQEPSTSARKRLIQLRKPNARQRRRSPRKASLPPRVSCNPRMSNSPAQRDNCSTTEIPIFDITFAMPRIQRVQRLRLAVDTPSGCPFSPAKLRAVSSASHGHTDARAESNQHRRMMNISAVSSLHRHARTACADPTPPAPGVPPPVAIAIGIGSFFGEARSDRSRSTAAAALRCSTSSTQLRWHKSSSRLLQREAAAQTSTQSLRTAACTLSADTYARIASASICPSDRNDRRQRQMPWKRCMIIQNDAATAPAA